MSKDISYKITLTENEVASINDVLTWYLDELKKTKIDKEKIVPCCEEDRETAFEQAKQSLSSSKKMTIHLLNKFSKK